MPMSPDRRGRSPPMGRSGGRGRGPPPYGGGGGGGYKVLCVSSLHPKASDDVIRDTLYREYKKYGDISVRVVQDPDERVAYVYFRNFEDARDAKHSKSRIILFDKPALVEAVVESRPVERERDPYPPQRSSRQRSMTPPGPAYHQPHHRYRSRSPLPPPHHMDHHHHHGPPQHHPRYQHREPYHPHHHRDDYHHGGGHHGGHHGPPHHHHHHHHPREYRDGPPPRMGRGGYGGRGGYDGGYKGMNHRGDPNKKDKFPNYLNHIPPEDDPLATRTLFTGNLELNITEEEMKRIFGKYGKLVDIDIKRPPPGTGNAYAFIRYENLDQAHKAKLELSGQYIGKFQCKIGYGKVNATPKVWVGGLGSWTSVPLLEREFDRFGAIQKIEFQSGEPQAFIYYETLEAAQAAVGEMRGFPLGGPDKRIRIDYSDLDEPAGGGPSDRDYSGGGGGYRGGRGGGRGGYMGGYNSRPRYDDGGRRREDEGDYPGSSGGQSPGASDGGLSSARTVNDICKVAMRVWEGGLILKTSLFPTKLFHVEGASRIADHLRDDQEASASLKITQRLRLDSNKLEDVSRRMNSSSSFAIFLGVPTSANVPSDAADVQSRPLRNLVSYLKQKEAAGVISLTSSDPDMNGGVLYCFPPCQYSLDLLKREAPDLDPEDAKDDHLVVLVVCGGTN